MVKNQLLVDIQYWIDNQSFKTQFQCFYNTKMPLNIVPIFFEMEMLSMIYFFLHFKAIESVQVSITYDLRIRFKIVTWFSFSNNLPHAEIWRKMVCEKAFLFVNNCNNKTPILWLCLGLLTHSLPSFVSKPSTVTKLSCVIC